jgi:hypothetical protein
MTKDEYLAF